MSLEFIVALLLVESRYCFRIFLNTIFQALFSIQPGKQIYDFDRYIIPKYYLGDMSGGNATFIYFPFLGNQQISL